MTSITVTDGTIDLRFSRWERLWLGRARLSVPVAAVRHVAVVDHPLRLARGARRGLVVSGLIKIGSWGLFGGTRRLVVAYRGRTGLHLILDREASGDEFDELVLSDPAAAAVAETVARALPVGR
jgi:hypothetical protein